MLSKRWAIVSALGILILVLSCGDPPSQGGVSSGPPPTFSASNSDSYVAVPPTATPALPPPTLPPDAPIPTGQPNSSIPAAQSSGPDPYLTYKPPFLPIKFTLNSSGISVEGDTTIVTPLGSFTLGASLPVVDTTQTLVIFRDTKKREDTLYRINAGRKLRVVVDGRTTID